MIYISTGCSNHKNAEEAVREIHKWGFNHIELTGGLQRIEDLESTLLKLKNTLDLNFQCHNYFPPPEKSFVLNLSSSGEILEKSLSLIKKSLRIGKFLSAERYGIHAGFRIDPKVESLGKKFDKNNLMPLSLAEERMRIALEEVQKTSIQFNTQVYVENNVFSDANNKIFDGNNPFLLCEFEDYQRMNTELPFRPLLDIGHLKVSCRSLGINYEEELEKFLKVSDYIHISDNDGRADQNYGLKNDSEHFGILKNLKKYFNPQCLTIEVYTGVKDVKETYSCLESII